MTTVKNTKMNSVLRPMYVKEILLDRTDEYHFITVNEIMEILESDYGCTTRRKTVYSDIDMLVETGMDIECVKGQMNKYHVLSHEFDIAELRMLIDAIASLKSIPLSKSEALISKISKLAGPSAASLVQCNNSDLQPRTSNSKVFYIIDKINKAVVTRKQITFKYYDYLTSSNKALKNKGHAYQVSPYRLACCNDFYYLIGFSEKHKKVTAFRVDRIYGIPTVTEMDNLPEPEGFYADDYIKESIHMKRDEIKEIILEFDVSVIDAITDRFGEDLNVSFVNKSDCRATVTTPINNIFFAWIFGFEGKVQIKEPSNIRDRYIRMVSKEMARL